MKGTAQVKQLSSDTEGINLPTGGTVRIQPAVWEQVQRKSVELSVLIGRPVKEATLIKLLLSRSINDVTIEDLAKLIEE